MSYLKVILIMKKVLSVLLSVLVIVLTLTPLAILAAKNDDAYAVIFTASDFQSDSCYSNLTDMMQNAQADGITETPDGFLFGGDYTADSEDPAVQVPKVTETVQAMYPDYDESKLVYVQGNHDGANSVLTPTGFYEFENYFVYSINEDDFKTGQYDRDGYDKTVEAKLAMTLSDLNLSVRATNCLENENITTVRELVVRNEDSLLEVRNFGETTLNEVKEKLTAIGLRLGMRIPAASNSQGGKFV